MVVIKRYIPAIIAFLLLITLAVVGYILLGNEKYMLVSVLAAFISCIPFFAVFERKRNNSREVVLIGVMTALCIAGRFIFTLIPHFKPVTALVIITGMYFGADAGFITGSLTALLSNMQHGQGPWTAFQMAIWGLIGFLAGVINKRGLLDKNKLLLIVFSAISGVLYSLVMDIYTTLSIDGAFLLPRYITYVLFSLGVMFKYVISNIVFIIFLQKPIGKKLERVKIKYGVFK